MEKHKFCCQNTIQNFYDHIISIPDGLQVKESCLNELSQEDFVIGLRVLSDIFKSIYADMIQSPDEYGLPLIEDIDYDSFNPKAAESKNSAHRLFALLNTLVQSSVLVGTELKVDNKNFIESLKKLKSIYKVSNSKMIMKKLCDFGFVFSDNTFSYPQNSLVIPVLYGYMKEVNVGSQAALSLNCYLVACEKPKHPIVISEYLSNEERAFFLNLNEFMETEGFIVGNSSDYKEFSFSIEYYIDSKDEKRIVRCFTDNSKLSVFVKLHNSDCYDYFTEKLPENIKQMFRKKSGCKMCKEKCSYRLYRTFEGVEYIDCGYGNWFAVQSNEIKDIDYYKQIIMLEIKSVRTKARQKNLKVYVVNTAFLDNFT